MEWLHQFYVLAALIGMSTGFFGSNTSQKELILLTAFLIYFLVVLVLLISLAIMYGRKSRYAEANAPLLESIETLKDEFSRLEYILRDDARIKSFDEDLLVKSLVKSLTSVSVAFSIITSVKCRTCIKIVGELEEAKNLTDNDSRLNYLYVNTFARDQVSSSTRTAKDRSEGKKHIIGKNTDFEEIAKQGGKPYFFCNDLSKLELYKNTSDSFNHDAGSGKPRKDYNSTIAWPISYILTKSEAIENGRARLKVLDQNFYGFFSVDAIPRGIFEERYDVTLGKIYTEALYPVLDLFASITAKKQEIEKIEKDAV
jgi:YHS domain-containing protein